jgi:hypothetical protein
LTRESEGIQLHLEREGDDAGDPKPYAVEELEVLHRAKGNEGRARHYADRRSSMVSPGT